ncbi:toll/interleukin-1 receptor domain-containing protein [Desulfobaculum sp. SPO524]|uniref:toll/interleukin-1 receptor domain-containing protein n=1 Tax=Desulfobaculum sp. SPO524 TaxID=3378071 RepID=UPI0038531F75
MIFLSHNHNDKVIVEQIAIRLRDTFGQENIFYDSWSVQPGDGIVDKMNEGLGACKLFLFFVSKNSLQSNMVKLEWQNAVVRATGGHTKIIPVKLDDCLMPPILLQSLYIDLFGQGIEVALRQIVDVASGRNTFNHGPQKFSNLRSYVYEEGGKSIVECRAEHFMEPKSNFLFLVENDKSDLLFNCRSSVMVHTGFHKGIEFKNGKIFNGQTMMVESATVPGFPFVVDIIPQNASSVQLAGVMHEKKKNYWEMIPLICHKPND